MNRICFVGSWVLHEHARAGYWARRVWCARRDSTARPIADAPEDTSAVCWSLGPGRWEKRGRKNRVREAAAPLTRNYGWTRSGSFGQELFDDLVSAVALTGNDQARKVEFQSGLDLARRNVVTARFQTLGQLFGTAEHPHRLATDIHLEEERLALTGLHAINLGDDRRNRVPFRGRCGARLDRHWFCRARRNRLPSEVAF